jgi:hypothetical protein
MRACDCVFDGDYTYEPGGVFVPLPKEHSFVCRGCEFCDAGKAAELHGHVEEMKRRTRLLKGTAMLRDSDVKKWITDRWGHTEEARIMITALNLEDAELRTADAGTDATREELLQTIAAAQRLLARLDRADGRESRAASGGGANVGIPPAPSVFAPVASSPVARRASSNGIPPAPSICQEVDMTERTASRSNGIPPAPRIR